MKFTLILTCVTLSFSYMPTMADERESGLGSLARLWATDQNSWRYYTCKFFITLLRHGDKALEFDVLFKASDDALYLSKTNGRNRITFGEVNVPEEP